MKEVTTSLLLLALAGCAEGGSLMAASATSAAGVLEDKPVLTGRVLDAAGAPQSDVLVEAFGFGMDQSPVTLQNGQTALIFISGATLAPRAFDRRILGYVPPGAKTDADGRFTIALPARGTYNLEAVATAELKGWRYKVDASASALPVGDLTLRETAVLKGRITMPEDKGSKEGADVYLAGSPYHARTEADGSYRFEKVPAGTVDVVAFKGNLKSKAICIDVVPGGETVAPDAPMAVVAP
ncbi:MAG: hypothetical protein VKO21_04720 [Candidatus Sericytochromatia bacterium]|nr:hypothetical protein [Candidatus Sericytochromatia bacterium]